MFPTPRGGGPYGITVTPVERGLVRLAPAELPRQGRQGDRRGRGHRAPDGRRGNAAGLVGLDRAPVDQLLERRDGGGVRPGRRLVAGVGPAGRRQPGVLDVRRRARCRLAVRLRAERDRAVRSGDGGVRVVPVRPADAAVRQMLGRAGEAWGAESGVDRLVVVRYDEARPRTDRPARQPPADRGAAVERERAAGPRRRRRGSTSPASKSPVASRTSPSTTGAVAASR